MITLTDVRKVYRTRNGDVTALNGINLHIPAGQIHGIVGESGAGKSTLIRCLTALENPTSGSVTVDGQELSSLNERQRQLARRNIGMVFQHVNLLDARTAAANIAYPLAVSGVPRTERKERVAQLLELVGLSGRGDSYPAQLSGGQRQRVGIARALATNPKVLLCDEPTSALDGATTRQILDLIRSLRDSLGITVVIITHEPAVVREICDAATLLSLGNIAESGSLTSIVLNAHSELAHSLIPLPPVPVPAGSTELLVYGGGTESEVAHALHAIATDPISRVVSGTIETIGAARVGRWSLEVPDGDVDGVVQRLENVGLAVQRGRQ